MRVLATTPPYHDYEWTVRGDLDPGIVEALRRGSSPWIPRTRPTGSSSTSSAGEPVRPDRAGELAGIEEAARAAGLLKD